MKLVSEYDDDGVKVWCHDEHYKGRLIMHANREQIRALIQFLFIEWSDLLYSCESCNAEEIKASYRLSASAEQQDEADSQGRV